MAYIITMRVALFCLENRTKPRMAGFLDAVSSVCVRNKELTYPSFRIVREVPIDKMLSKVAFALPIVDEKVHPQVARDIHSRSIMHIGL